MFVINTQPPTHTHKRHGTTPPPPVGRLTAHTLLLDPTPVQKNIKHVWISQYFIKYKIVSLHLNLSFYLKGAMEGFNLLGDYHYLLRAYLLPLACDRLTLQWRIKWGHEKFAAKIGLGIVSNS